MIYILFICMVVMFIAIYIKVQKDVFSPSLLFVIAYVVAIGCALLNVKRWNIELLPITFMVLLLGAVEFVVISLWIDKYYEKKNSIGDLGIAEDSQLHVVQIERWKVAMACVGCIGYCVLLYIKVLDIAGKYGNYQSFSQALNFYKAATSVTLQYSLPGWLLQIQRIAMICAYLFAYIFLNNIMVSSEKIVLRLKKNIALIVPVCVYLVGGILNSDRLQILQLIIAGIVMFFLIWARKSGRKFISTQTLLILCGAACGGLLLFYFSAGMIGRITDKGLFEYITYYCGCGIECLNQFFKVPPEGSDIIGKETFYNLNLKLYNLGILKLDKFYPIHLEFRYYNDIMLGNVYTAYRRWIYDFGFLGAALLQGFMALFMSVFYNRVKYCKFKNNGFWMILYGYLAYSIIFHPYDGYLYIQYVSYTFAITIALLRLAYWFFIEMHVKVKTKKW